MTIRFAALGFTMGALATSTQAQALCGDFILDSNHEECDEGPTGNSSCSSDCLLSCNVVNVGATDHTCTHGTYGPFVSVPGFSYPGAVLGNVSSPHTYYTLTLSGEPGNNRSATEFQPVVNESYALYMKENYPLVLRTLEGELVPIRFEHAISSCAAVDSLTWVRVYHRLDTSTSYVVDVGPWEEGTVSFAFESLGAFREEYFFDQDGDDHVSERPSAIAGCQPLEGNLVAPGDDCDDRNDTSFPGGVELCDGTDNNCDGHDDNEVDECSESLARPGTPGQDAASPFDAGSYLDSGSAANETVVNCCTDGGAIDGATVGNGGVRDAQATTQAMGSPRPTEQAEEIGDASTKDANRDGEVSTVKGSAARGSGAAGCAFSVSQRNGNFEWVLIGCALILLTRRR